MIEVPARLRGVVERTPLRVQIVAALLALVTLALVVTGVAATTALRGYLVDRVDSQLVSAAEPLLSRPEGPRRFDRPGPEVYRPPSDFYAQVSDAAGQVTEVVEPTTGDTARPAMPLLDARTAALRAGHPFTVSASAGGGEWRVLVVPLRNGAQTVSLGLELDGVDSTVRRLQLIVVVVSLVVLALLTLLVYAFVRASLRPLEAVETTAAAIAAGDLSRRVREGDPRTEVGRLSRALNGMLTQIEAAFRARSQSEADARRSEERMRRFVADASHELRTPLTSIRGFAELYRQGAAEDPAEVARAMARIEAEASRMGLLVEDLLLLARLDQQRPLERRPVDLLELATDAVHDARAVAPNRPVDLRVLGDEAPIVLGDDARLRQVVGNLITNALTHTPDGTPVTVAVGSADGRVVLEVADEGPGLAPDEAARVFERFYRADPSRTREQGGSGLGLSIVAALVAAHGGTVEVDTAPGAGARFVVALPPAGTPSEPVPASQVPHR